MGNVHPAMGTKWDPVLIGIKQAKIVHIDWIPQEWSERAARDVRSYVFARVLIDFNRNSPLALTVMSKSSTRNYYRLLRYFSLRVADAPHDVEAAVRTYLQTVAEIVNQELQTVDVAAIADKIRAKVVELESRNAAKKLDRWKHDICQAITSAMHAGVFLSETDMIDLWALAQARYIHST